MLEFDGEFLTFLLKTWKKSAVKHSIQKPILLNFVNIFTTLYPGLKETGKLLDGNPEDPSPIRT